MLRNVLAAFLSSCHERQLDVPLTFLLPAMGFYDVHLVHSSAEFGKDIIAKRAVGNDYVQYVFQTKSGNINQSGMRGEVIPQLLETVTVNLSHPSFDAGMPRQTVLVTSGEVKGNAALELPFTSPMAQSPLFPDSDPSSSGAVLTCSSSSFDSHLSRC